MWPFKPKKPSAPLAKLIFKNADDFFEYQCRFGVTDIVENMGLVAIVQTGADFSAKDYHHGPAHTQTVGLKVVSRDGGFEVFAQPFAHGPLLRTGDCVIWVPMVYHAEFSVLSGDPRSGWVGFIPATIAPEIDPNTDSFEILQRYDLS